MLPAGLTSGRSCSLLYSFRREICSLNTFERLSLLTISMVTVPEEDMCVRASDMLFRRRTMALGQHITLRDTPPCTYTAFNSGNYNESGLTAEGNSPSAHSLPQQRRQIDWAHRGSTR